VVVFLTFTACLLVVPSNVRAKFVSGITLIVQVWPLLERILRLWRRICWCFFAAFILLSSSACPSENRLIQDPGASMRGAWMVNWYVRYSAASDLLVYA